MTLKDSSNSQPWFSQQLLDLWLRFNIFFEVVYKRWLLWIFLFNGQKYQFSILEFWTSFHKLLNTSSYRNDWLVRTSFYRNIMKTNRIQCTLLMWYQVSMDSYSASKFQRVLDHFKFNDGVPFSVQLTTLNKTFFPPTLKTKVSSSNGKYSDFTPLDWQNSLVVGCSFKFMI